MSKKVQLREHSISEEDVRRALQDHSLPESITKDLIEVLEKHQFIRSRLASYPQLAVTLKEFRTLAKLSEKLSTALAQSCVDVEPLLILAGGSDDDYGLVERLKGDLARLKVLCETAITHNQTTKQPSSEDDLLAVEIHDLCVKHNLHIASSWNSEFSKILDVSLQTLGFAGESDAKAQILSRSVMKQRAEMGLETKRLPKSKISAKTAGDSS